MAEHLTKPLDLARLREVKRADACEVGRDGSLRLRVDLGRNEARVVYVFGG